ncbi:MAG TPA: hypothetical protein VF669_12750 [Tepidisphaeraceae bacterium]|jgi:hypothetical protein
MNKRQLIDNIRKINVSVRPEFLAQFDEPALAQYLDHLSEAQNKRLQMPAWVRKQPMLRMVS